MPFKIDADSEYCLHLILGEDCCFSVCLHTYVLHMNSKKKKAGYFLKKYGILYKKYFFLILRKNAILNLCMHSTYTSLINLCEELQKSKLKEIK